MSKSDGGAAFPTDFSYECDECKVAVMATTPHVGMSLRDYFAAKAMQGMLSSCETTTIALVNLFKKRGLEPDTAIASMSYEYADAMLAERSKP